MNELYEKYLEDQRSDNCAAGYDEKYLPFLETLIPTFDFQKATILDVGARSFNSWDYFLKYGNKITGIDIGREGLEFCSKHGKTGMIDLDAHKMLDVFSSESFDLVISFHAFEHMFNLPTVLSNCYTVLKPNGYLFAALPIPCFNWGRGHWYDVKDNNQMLQLLGAAGFTKVIFQELFSDLRFRPEQEMVFLVQK